MHNTSMSTRFTALAVCCNQNDYKIEDAIEHTYYRTGSHSYQTPLLCIVGSFLSFGIFAHSMEAVHVVGHAQDLRQQQAVQMMAITRLLSGFGTYGAWS